MAHKKAPQKIVESGEVPVAASQPTCWVIFDAGKVGTGNQCIGLAEALGLTPVVYEISARFPWKYLIPSMWFNSAKGIIDQEGKFLTAPWPDVIIAAGRASAAPVVEFRRLSQGKTKTIQLQSPTMSPKHFDLVIAPVHDRYYGPNVLHTKGALHRVTKERLQSEAERVKDTLAHLPRPLVTVLVGGTNRRYSLTPEVVQDLKQKLKHWVDTYGVGIAILPSRRTEIVNREELVEAFKDMPAVIWDCKSENPYFGYLGLADYIVVTSDSVSMTSEACFTGKPVYTYHLPGGAAVSRRFHSLFEKEGFTRPMGEKLETWTYPVLDEFPRILAEIKSRLKITS
jgi:mitochondrial fission protein ELM1